MPHQQPIRVSTISEYHRFLQLPAPAHPLVSVVRFEAVQRDWSVPVTRVMDFYSIAIKRNPHVMMKYGQQAYDFDEGVMFCMSPGQTLCIEAEGKPKAQTTGWMLLFHPDLLWNTPLAKTMRQYEYFDYSVREALFLSPKEEEVFVGMLQFIDRECSQHVDKFSQDIIVAQIELLLKYAERFYHRQFLTRKKGSHQVLDRLEQILSGYFNSDELLRQGLPTVAYIARELNISPNYLSELLKTLTGQSTQQHIHEKLIEKAKEKLSTTGLSVGEIAYGLGFEHPQSFTKLFKAKTSLSPVAFRNSFN